MQGRLEVQLQEAREALAHQEADTEASSSETRVLARQLEVRPGWPPGISSFPFSPPHKRVHPSRLENGHCRAESAQAPSLLPVPMPISGSILLPD